MRRERGRWLRQMRQKTRKEESEKVDFEGKVQCGNYFTDSSPVCFLSFKE